MFGNPFKKKPSQVDPLIAVVLTRMAAVEPDSDEHAALTTRLKQLNEIKAQEREGRVSRDTLAIVAANFAGILLIVAYEQAHPFTSKALSQVLRKNP